MWNYIQYGEGWLFFAFFYSQNKECSFEAAQTTSCVKKERKIKEEEEIYYGFPVIALLNEAA